MNRSLALGLLLGFGLAALLISALTRAPAPAAAPAAPAQDLRNSPRVIEANEFRAIPFDAGR
jgi:hypothetical protein